MTEQTMTIHHHLVRTMCKVRAFLGLALFLVLSACAVPLLNTDAARDVKVVDLGVNVSQIRQVEGRPLAIDALKIQRDIHANVLNSLGKVPLGGREVNVDIVVTRVHLVPPDRALQAGGASSIEGTVQMSDALTGEALLPPTKVVGTAKKGYALRSLVRSAIKAGRTPEEDYRATVTGFSAEIRDRMFGPRTKPTIIIVEPTTDGTMPSDRSIATPEVPESRDTKTVDSKPDTPTPAVEAPTAVAETPTPAVEAPTPVAEAPAPDEATEPEPDDVTKPDITVDKASSVKG